MDCKLINYRLFRDGVLTDTLQIRFTASINSIAVTGKLIICWSPERNIVYQRSYNLRLKFDNKAVKKHPEYKEIRSTMIFLLDLPMRELTPGVWEDINIRKK